MGHYNPCQSAIPFQTLTMLPSSPSTFSFHYFRPCAAIPLPPVGLPVIPPLLPSAYPWQWCPLRHPRGHTIARRMLHRPLKRCSLAIFHLDNRATSPLSGLFVVMQSMLSWKAGFPVVSCGSGVKVALPGSRVSRTSVHDRRPHMYCLVLWPR